MTGIPADGPMSPSPKNSSAVGDDGNGITLAGIGVGKMLVLLNFQTRFRYAGRIGNGSSSLFVIGHLHSTESLPFHSACFFNAYSFSGPWFVPFIILCMQEISRSDISGITTKAPYEAARMNERHVRVEICISLCARLSQKH